LKFFQGRYPATALAVLAAAALAFAQGGGKGALILWPLFGTSNQLLAGLVLLVASVYLLKRGAKIWVTAVPMVFMVITSSWAMLVNLSRFFNSGQWHLVAAGGLILLLEVWMIYEAVNVVMAMKNARP
jgi:carbon starvation protein